MFLWQRCCWREAEDLYELVLQDGKIGIAFLKDVGTKRETNGNVITSMGFRLRSL
jgi:hypothetical protein